MDIGNTRTKFAVVNNGHIQVIAAIVNIDVEIKVEQDVLNTLTELKNIYICSVGSEELVKYLSNLFNNKFNIKITRLLTQVNFNGITNGYSNFKELGVDRWMAMLAVASKNNNFAVICAGTAITVDLVINNKHLGGYIVPTSKLLHNSLTKQTALLPLVNKTSNNNQTVLGRTTEEAIINGTNLMITSFINSVILDFKSKYGDDLSIHSTGGNYREFKILINHNVVYSEDLIFQGMQKVIES